MTMWEQIFFWTTVACYVLSTLVYAYKYLWQKEGGPQWELYLLYVGLGANSITMLLRAGSGANLLIGLDFEDGLIIAALTVVVFLYWQKKISTTAPVALICLPFAFLMMGFGYFSIQAVKPLKASLISHWMIIHAIFALIATACLIYATGLSVIYLLKSRYPAGGMPEKYKKLPTLEVLNDLSFRLVLLGFASWTVMVITGAFWAKDAYGRYWSWDPIEVWSLVSWLAWGLYLHLSFTFKNQGKLVGWLCIASFLVTLITMWGVDVVSVNSYHYVQHLFR